MKFTREIGDGIVYTLLKLPEAEMDKGVKIAIQSFLAKPYDSTELYNFLNEIARLPTVKVRNHFVGGISGLTKVTARLAKDYDPPDADESRMIDLEWCEDQLSKYEKRFCKS